MTESAPTVPLVCDDPLHMGSGADTPWTTTNVGEAMPGVQTPLGWTFWRDACELAVRKNFWRLGALARSEVPVPEQVDDRFSAVFFGRAAGNVRMFREMGDRLPGTSGDAVEEQLFGVRRPGGERRHRRPSWVAPVKLPAAAIQTPRHIRRLRAESDRWWRAAVAAPPSDLAGAVALLGDAQRRFEATMSWHCLVTMLAQGAYEQVTKLALSAGLGDGVALDLVAGLGGSEEVRLLEDLWAVARGGMAEEVFLVRHGYHGPDEGEISSHSWREDPSPLRSLMASYAEIGDGARPAMAEGARTDKRRRAEAELRRALTGLRRLAARPLLAAARKFIPLREVGKAAFLQTIDGARLAARAAGGALVAAGRLTDPDDVFFVTLDELVAGRPPEAHVIQARRAARERYLALDLPSAWVGPPQPIPRHSPQAARGEAGVVLHGLGVSPGAADGAVRVVLDPARVEAIDAGDVLVCHTTDPAWASLMFLAGALVVDVGGPMSHAAIVARELGVPCVVGTGDGTARLRDGDRVRVDGTAGVVTELVAGEQAPGGWA